jgi:hypothetical protein
MVAYSHTDLSGCRFPLPEALGLHVTDSAKCISVMESELSPHDRDSVSKLNDSSTSSTPPTPHEVINV